MTAVAQRRARVTHHVLVVALLLVPMAACGSGGGPRDDFVVHRDTLGDTIRIHIASGSSWGGPAELSEELRIGALEGGDSTKTFGQIEAVATDNAGGLFVFDDQVPALRSYDARGRFLRNLGGEGQGPGEYGNAASGLYVRPDGRVVLYDMRTHRVNTYTHEGRLISTTDVPSGLFTFRAMALDTAGDIYIKVLLVQLTPGKVPSRWPVGLLHMKPGGTIVDTLRPPLIPGSASSDEAVRPNIWEISPWDDLVVSREDGYAFDIRHPDGSVVRVWRDVPPVMMTDGEVKAYEARGYHDLDHTKPAIWGFRFGDDGTIWVWRSSPAEPIEEPLGIQDPMVARAPNWLFYEPLVFDVYRRDGTFLGEVPFPRDVRPYVFSLSRIYGITAGKYDEEYVVGYRVKLP